MIPILIPHLSALASIAVLGWAGITIPANDTLRRLALFPLILAPIGITIVTAPDAGPVQLWNIYLGMMFGSQLVLGCFHLLFIAREEYHNGYMRKHVPNGNTASIKKPTSLGTAIFDKIRFSVDLVINKRRIGHPDQVPYVPAFNRSRGKSYIPSRRQFLLYRTTRFVLFYLALDLLTLQDLEDAEIKCAPGQERILSRLLARSISGPELAELVGMVIAYGVCGAIALTACYDFVSVLAVGPGRFLLGGADEGGAAATHPASWPPLFGDPRQAYSLRRFWAFFWHQQFRTVLMSISGFVVYDVLRLPKSMPRSSSQRPPQRRRPTLTLILTRYVRLFVALLLSGILHINSDRVQHVHPRDSGAVRFFIWQFLGIVIEDCAQAVYARMKPNGHTDKTQSVVNDGPATWARTLGYIWVAVFMVLVAPTWMFPVLRAGQATVVPVSFVRWMIK